MAPEEAVSDKLTQAMSLESRLAGAEDDKFENEKNKQKKNWWRGVKKK